MTIKLSKQHQNQKKDNDLKTSDKTYSQHQNNNHDNALTLLGNTLINQLSGLGKASDQNQRNNFTNKIEQQRENNLGDDEIVRF